MRASYLGAFLINNTGNNAVPILLFGLISLYIIMLVWLSNKAHEATFPMAIFMISMALLLMRGLTFDFLGGDDNIREFITFREVILAGRWSMLARFSGLAASLSVSLLPAIFQSWLGINALYVYKAVYMVLFALIP